MLLEHPLCDHDDGMVTQLRGFLARNFTVPRNVTTESAN